ncbi:MAG: hypothetical protein WA807_01215 [Steroidobacteraceae bacterium]
MDKRYMVGGLIGAMVVGSVSVEVCEREAGASACPAPRIEWNHDHMRSPKGPFVQPPYVLGTSTGTGGTSIPPAITPSADLRRASDP